MNDRLECLARVGIGKHNGRELPPVQSAVRMKHVSAKPLAGFGGAGVLEAIENHDGNTFRAVYTVRLAGAVYVLHAFQKKSKKGRATPRAEIELVRRRLKGAEEHDRQLGK